jgi:hypothetical protein
MSSSTYNSSGSNTANEQFGKNLLYSAILSGIFFTVSYSGVYSVTDKAVSRYGHTYENDCPTPEGKLLHTIVFYLLAYITIWVLSYLTLWAGSKQMIKCAIFATLLFFFVSSPDVYQLTNGLSGNQLANAKGCPTTKGVITHSFVFLVLVLLMSYLPY